MLMKCSKSIKTNRYFRRREKMIEKQTFDFEKMMDSMNIVIASYGFVINFFPIYK